MDKEENSEKENEVDEFEKKQDFFFQGWKGGTGRCPAEVSLLLLTSRVRGIHKPGPGPGPESEHIFGASVEWSGMQPWLIAER